MEKNILSQEANTSNSPLHTSEGAETGINSNNESDPVCVPCPLCAIEVPRRFINQHYESVKHKINAKIADIALGRVQKLLNCKIVSDFDKTDSLASYFCPQCVISLDPKDRQSHDETVIHKNALIVDKFLYDIYILYSNDDRNSDIPRECEETVSVSSTVKPNNETDISLNIDENPAIIISEEIEVQNGDNINNGDNDNDGDNDNNGDNDKNGDNIDISNEKIIETDPLKNKNVNSNVIEIKKTANSPITNKVDSSSPSNNSSFCTFGYNKHQIYCTTCRVYLPNNADNVTSHERGVKHKAMLRKINSKRK